MQAATKLNTKHLPKPSAVSYNTHTKVEIVSPSGGTPTRLVKSSTKVPGGGLVGSGNVQLARQTTPDKHAVKIQAACRGFLARKQVISGLLAEVRFLREERSFLAQKYENIDGDLKTKNETIDRLEKQLKTKSQLENSMTSLTHQFVVGSSCAAPLSKLKISQKIEAFVADGARRPINNPAGQISKSIWAPVGRHTSASSASFLNSDINSENADQSAPYDTSYTGSDDTSYTTYVEPYHHIPKSFSNIANCRAIWSPIESVTTTSRTVDSASTSSPSSTNFSIQQPENYFASGKEDSNFNPTNFQYLVDKIVKTNDQPASLFLQHKLRFSSQEVNQMIFTAIVTQAPTLMKNRFGNFLMQKVIEHGTPDQIRTIGMIVKGNVLGLSTDRFACHVVQKAIDFVDAKLKSEILAEILKVIPETITHKFGCHVWQRLFETGWVESSENVNDGRKPDILMASIDSSLQGKWHVLANDENGSLVLQCIFENCTEVERTPIVTQVLNHLVEISMGQWGNWVVQHVVEHGTQKNKEFIIKTLTQNVFIMSIDQYASKVVEKILKIAGKRDLYEIIDHIIRPSIPSRGQKRAYILEMMNNQYGNYVVQHILQLAEAEQRDVCVRLISPHLGVLRYSKYGQRVAAIADKILKGVRKGSVDNLSFGY